MAVRLKTRWHHSRRERSRGGGAKTLADRASVVGFNVWKIAFNAYKHMEGEGFRFASDPQIAAVLSELLCYLIQVTDRTVFGQVPEEDRQALVVAVARQSATTLAENMAEAGIPGDHAAAFVVVFNERARDYADFGFEDGRPAYQFNRLLGERISAAMAGGDNRWAVEHVMEIEIPEMLKLLRRVLGEVLGIRAA